MARPRKAAASPAAEEPRELTSADAEQARYEAAAALIGDPEPVPVRPEPKPDHRNAIEIERAEQAKVEAALRMRLVGRPLKGADDA